MIRFLRFLSEARNKPPLHAMNNDLFTLNPVPPPNHRQIRPRRNIIRRPVPKKSEIDFTNGASMEMLRFEESGLVFYRSIWIFRVGRLARLHARAMSSERRVQRALPHMVFSDTNPFLCFGILREVEGRKRGKRFGGVFFCFYRPLDVCWLWDLSRLFAVL